MTMDKKKVLMLVTSDLVTDQRVQRHALLLLENGYDVTLVGREKKNSLEFSVENIRSVRFKIWFEKGLLFYATFNLKLFFCVLFAKTDIIWANDLDTLLPSYLVSKMRSKVLIYDTHEYFTGVPELQNRRFIKSVWIALEKWILPQIKNGLTVSDSVAQRYFNEYGVSLTVVRNMPSRSFEIISTLTVNLPMKPFILYQGVLNKDRGLEELIIAMQWLSDYTLVLAGKGDVEEDLKQLVKQLSLSSKVFFLGLLKPVELKKITPLAILGVSIEKPTNPNYEMCLPNKLFDYIQAGIPILAYPHIEIKKIIDQYQCGTFINSHEPKVFAKQLNAILKDKNKLAQWATNSKEAAFVLNWEREREVLIKWIDSVLSGKK